MAFDTPEVQLVPPHAAGPSEEPEALAARAPGWARELLPSLPAGVAVLGDRLTDRIPDVAIPLETHHLELFAALQPGVSVGDLDRRFPGCWPLLQRLNSNHMLNLGSARRFDLSLRRSSRPYRYSLGERGLSVASTFGGILRCVGRTARHPLNAVLLAFAATLALSAGSAGAQRAAVVAGLAVLGYALHEWGHALAASRIGARAYALSQPLSVSVWAKVDGDREARLFAAAGPITACLFGVTVHSIAVWLGEARPWVFSAPLMVHALALTPLCHDGRTLLRGARSRRAKESLA